MTDVNSLRVQILAEGAKPPAKAEPGAAGYDLYALCDASIPRGTRRLVPTGIAVAPPYGTYGRIAPRSSLSCKGIDVGAGVVDASYRGEVKVMLINNTDTPTTFAVRAGDRIAQLVLERIVCGEGDAIVCDELPPSERGTEGFGSTGR